MAAATEKRARRERVLVGPGFSERTFEFCYNAEYCQIHTAVLATHPHIPSQNAEKELGYDVEFKINEGNYTKSVFLQHKVSSYAAVRAGRNAQFYATHGGPYYRFVVDNHQHNVLCELSRTKGNAFYCAPRFHLRRELETHYRGTAITAHSMLLNPLDPGDIQDDDRHNITYGIGVDPTATLHSEPRRFKRAFGGGRENAPELKSQPITGEYIQALSEELARRITDSKLGRSIAAEVEHSRPIEQVQFILGRVFRLTWFLLP